MIMGVDMGGTNIRTGLFTSEGRLQNKSIKIHYGSFPPQKTIDLVVLEVNNILKKEGLDLFNISAMGVGFPGHVNFKRGIALTTSNLPQWDDIPLRDILEDRLKIPVYLDNDANLAALAEHLFGAGKGAKNMIYLTVSSGIGAGVIINGKIYRGNRGTAGEIGHTTLDINGPVCTCGKRGCLMAMASGIGIANIAKGVIRKGKKTLIKDLAQNDINKITAKVIAEAAFRGDEFAENLIEQTARSLGIGLANLVEIFDPEMIIVGGGLSKIKEKFLELVEEVAIQRVPEQLRDSVNIVSSPLGSDAGLIGAASLVITERNQNRGD
ncbi:MAG: ROK family protein [Candidatus Aerophobus sp.]|nr:MAG: ROK family protein [Candidatus Aerophobus sp.]